MNEVEPLKELLKTHTKNLTFKEAFEKTGIILNIAITEQETYKCRLLNYIESPDVYIWSAVLASCSLPLFYPP